MAYRRRTRRSRRKPRKSYRRSRRRSNRRRLGQYTTYKFTRIAQLTPVAGSTTTDTFGAFVFNLGDVPSFSEFSSLYDQYQITGVKLWFVPRLTEVTGTTTTTGNFWYWPDFDDATLVTSMAQVFQIQGVKFRQANGRPFSIFLRPKPIDGVYTGTGTFRASAPRTAWIDTASTDIPHFGIKWGLTIGSYINGLDVYGKYYLKFKGVR